VIGYDSPLGASAQQPEAHSLKFPNSGNQFDAMTTLYKTTRSSNQSLLS